MLITFKLSKLVLALRCQRTVSPLADGHIVIPTLQILYQIEAKLFHYNNASLRSNC